MKLSTLAQMSLFVGATTVAQYSFAQDKIPSDTLTKVVEAGASINTSAAKSQHRIDGINADIQSKLQQFKTVTKEVDGLNVYNSQMQTQIQNQVEELKQLAESMEQVSIIERQISPLMARMISTLETFVSLDIPFLAQERANRLAGLTDMLTKADVAVSEKFRRVLEAYQVEVDYGRTIEAYTGIQTIDGVERDVDFLRIGRVSFVYQTRDGQNLGMWDQATKTWQALPEEYRLAMNKGLRIARKQLAPDLITVPVIQTSVNTSAE